MFYSKSPFDGVSLHKILNEPRLYKAWLKFVSKTRQDRMHTKRRLVPGGKLFDFNNNNVTT